MDDITRYFNVLFGEIPPDQWLLLWRLADKRSFWFRDLKLAEEFCRENAATSVYAGMGLSPENFGPSKRCEAGRVTAVGGLWSDLDTLSPAHQKKNLPPTMKDALSILPSEFPPTMVVHSGHGLQAYWALKELEIFDDPGERQAMQELTERWHRLISWRAQAKRWSVDATYDLARILRVPGTTNIKIPTDPVVARIIELNERRYNLSEFEEYLNSFTQPDEAMRRARQLVPERVDGGLIVTLDRQFNPEKLAILKQEIFFAQTWNHEREFADQTQSVYDLALANLGYDAGLSDQEIVDMLIQNRREHGAATKLRGDYYRRTLAKSRVRHKATPAIEPPSPEANDESDPEQPPPPPPAPDDEASLREKMEQTQVLSACLGIKIERIFWFRTSKPSWRMELGNGDAITFSSSSQILDQKTFRDTIFGQAGVIIKKRAAQAWHSIIKILEAAQIKVDTEEDDDKNNMASILDRYLIEMGVAPDRGEVLSDAKRSSLPFAYESRIAVQLWDVQEWAARVGRKHEKPEMIRMFHALGAKSKNFTVGGGRTSQNRWILPESFSIETYQRAELRARLTKLEPMERAG